MKTKQEKRLDAEARNLTWKGLTTQQKIQELHRWPGKCNKQLTKLSKEI